MINTSLIKYSLVNLGKRKTRSFLTILSVLIGITAITTLISFGNGISSYVEDISQQMGDDKLIVQARGFGLGIVIDGNVRLDDTDLDAVRDVNGVEEATGMYLISGEIEFKDQKKYAYVMGSDFEKYSKLITEVYTVDIIEGQELKGDEKTKAILGYNYRLKDKIFEQPVHLRDKILVNGQEIRVAGFYEEVGNPQDDSNIYITTDAAEELFGADNYYWILARSAPGRDPIKLAETVAEELRDHRNQGRGNEDFFVQTFEQAIETFNAILGVITTVVILIAFISIIVAAVNIMNTMYASILERTKEIGVLKAIGSRNKDILFIFVLESSTLSLLGGIIGVILGYWISRYAGGIIAQAGYGFFSPLFNLSLIIGSLIFALFIGLVSGLLPAYRASKLQPVDALRYE
jgi:putative ABC transport system permease protein